METKKMIALQSFLLRGNRINPGDVFDAKRKDVLMLSRVNFAELADDEATTATEAAAQRAQAEARKPPAPKASVVAPKPKPAEKNLDAMSVADLRREAKAMGLELQAGIRKQDLLNKVRRGRYSRRDMRAE